jgi:hypothetical protein
MRSDTIPDLDDVSLCFFFLAFVFFFFFFFFFFFPLDLLKRR